MQETALSLSRGGPDSEFAMKDEDGHQVQCDLDQNGEICEGFNCYTSDQQVIAGIKSLKARNQECTEKFKKAQMKAAKDEEELEAEIKDNGNVKPETIKHLEEEGAPGEGALTDQQLDAANAQNARQAQTDPNQTVDPGSTPDGQTPVNESVPVNQ